MHRAKTIDLCQNPLTVSVTFTSVYDDLLTLQCRKSLSSRGPIRSPSGPRTTPKLHNSQSHWPNKGYFTLVWLLRIRTCLPMQEHRNPPRKRMIQPLTRMGTTKEAIHISRMSFEVAVRDRKPPYNLPQCIIIECNLFFTCDGDIMRGARLLISTSRGQLTKCGSSAYIGWFQHDSGTGS